MIKKDFTDRRKRNVLRACNMEQTRILFYEKIRRMHGKDNDEISANVRFQVNFPNKEENIANKMGYEELKLLKNEKRVER